MQRTLQAHHTVSGLWGHKGVFHQKLIPERTPALLPVSPQLTLLTWKGLKVVNTSRVHLAQYLIFTLTDLNKVRKLTLFTLRNRKTAVTIHENGNTCNDHFCLLICAQNHEFGQLMGSFLNKTSL